MSFLKSLALGLFLAAGACTTTALPPKAPATPKAPPATIGGEAALVQSLLAELQKASIQQGVEYCGYVGRAKSGELVLSKPTRGDTASCLPAEPRNIAQITASFHTHGGFDAAYTGELPSTDDVEGDYAMKINGYVSTPAGRFWFVDTTRRVIVQLCGFGCLPNDSRFTRGDDGPIAQQYTFKELALRLNA